jgi:hypothetical protein
VGSPLSQPGADTSSGLGGAAGGTRITQPKDGQFGVVVVGTSLSERYPETAAIWGGRLVYTVYLHVGLGKSWILQYSMPLSKEAAVAGSALRPEAPWPYEIVRPSLDPADFQTDAILVRGVVNRAGYFEQLAIVSPIGSERSKLLLAALQRWQFRPARQNGLLAAVEVLLLIPEEIDE